MTRTMIAAALCLSVLAPAEADAQVMQLFHHSFEPVEVQFFEPFTWQGNHAATIHAGDDHDHSGTTVWWNEDHWDVRGDTGYLPTELPVFDPPIGVVKGYHIDVHKSATADPHDGEEDNHAEIVGGDGTPGVAAMRIDYQGISSARLRNPLKISEAVPGVVEFYAPKFVTTAHWWEIALTPTAQVTGGENTTVPAAVAKPPFEDSLNFVAIGLDDIPCDTGWFVDFEVHRSVGGVETMEELNRPFGTPYPAIDPTQKMVLTHWKLEFRPSGVDLYADLDRNGQDEHVHHYAVGVPWSEAYVHLLGVAYQADHHPQDPACYQGVSRELVWRHVKVGPVKYARTSVAPQNAMTENVQRTLGWLGYDTRDIQRFGPGEPGAPQANAARYQPYGSMAFASVDLTVFGGTPPVSTRTLPVTLSADQAAAARAQLTYDIKGRGTATLVVNGTPVGTLPGTTTLRYFAAAEPGDNLLFEFAHRSIDIPVALLHSGANQVQVQMTGEVVMDRLQLEFAHR